MRYFIGLLTVGFIAMLFVVKAPQSAAVAETQTGQTIAAERVEDQPVTSVMFYSNWCGACQILDPKLEKAKLGFTDRPVDFVKFNFSYAMVQGAKLQALAEEKNLTNIYAKNKGKTGFVLLIEPKTERVMDVITMRDSVEEITAKLERSLQRAANSPDAKSAG
ncbi:hypothetical protein MNBD_ALPHA06-1891 [hydrothermal vent metagenome]|uniref:Thioredoxin domain-containing protein n=1 Tax=hydrothermal vent metagenome TaxID=652676 RepID=A0A3B0SCG6_9ZZZZ